MSESPYAALDTDTRARAAEYAQALLHDVAKYITRTARNVTAGEAPTETLAAMLLKDVYALDGTRPASAVFRERAAPLRAVVEDVRLEHTAALLERMDARETDARAGHESALRELVSLSLEVASTLRAVAADARGEA